MEKLPEGDVRLHVVRDKTKEIIEVIERLEDKVRDMETLMAKLEKEAKANGSKKTKTPDKSEGRG